MAASNLTPTTTLPSSGGVLVVATAAFMPPRLLLAPAGARLPRGVHAVVAFPAEPVAAARRSLATAAAASEAAGDAGDDDDKDKQQQEVALFAAQMELTETWRNFEQRGALRENSRYEHGEPYEMVCFDYPVVSQLEMHAWRGAELVTNILFGLGPEMALESHLNNIKEAGIAFRRVALQGRRGYVRAGSVREAAHKLALLYAETISCDACPAIPPSPALDDPPSPMMDPSGYYKGLIESFAKTISAAHAGVVRCRFNIRIN